MVANVVSTPATFRPPFTTLFHRRAITSPKAVARDVEMVLRTSAIEILRSSAISNPDARWARVPKPFPEANKYRSAGAHALLLRHDPHAFNPRARILPLRVFLERLRHVPNREQRNRDAVERLHLDAGLRDDSIGPHVERHARGGDRDRMCVREDLPHRLHGLKGGHLRGGNGISFLDATGADRPDRRGLESDLSGGHGAPVEVWLPTDVDHLRHDDLRYAARYFSVRPLSIATRASDANPGGATRARKDVVKSRRRTRKALCTMPGPLDDSVRMGCA